MISKRLPGIRHLTPREKLILRLALGVALLMLLVNGLPALTAIYQSRAVQVETLRADIDREQRLLDDADSWRQRSEAVLLQQQQFDDSLFAGSSVALLTAAIQRQVRQIAAETGLTVNSANLAESRESGDWTLVEQSVTFTTNDQHNTLAFLQRLTAAQPALKVTRFSLRPSRNQYLGEITVVGFNRADPAVSAGPSS